VSWAGSRALEGAVGVLGEVFRAAVRDGRVGVPERMKIQWPTSWAIVKRNAASRGVAAHGLRGIDDDQALRGTQQPGADAQALLLDPKAEEILGDRFDGYRYLAPPKVARYRCARSVGQKSSPRKTRSENSDSFL
jgi:hypothetical protein